MSRVLLWAMVPAAAGGAHLGLQPVREDAALQHAAEALRSGDAAAARAALLPLAHSARHGERARAGLEIARAQAGDEPAGTGLFALHTWPLHALLDAWQLRRDLAGTRALAALATRAGAAFGPAYEAAARLDAGDLAGARAVVDGGARVFAAPGLGRRVARVLELREAGASVVLDRRGGLLGSMAADGSFQPEDGVPAGWVPPTIAQAVAALSPTARSSIDVPLSRMATEALGPYRGTIVLVDVRTGAVLAAASDALTAARAGDTAFTDQREPASISKLITSTAAQRAGLDPDAEIGRTTCTGVGHYGGGTLWCAYPGGALAGLPHALAISCNVAFADLGLKVGRAALLAELRRYGFDRADLPGAGRIRQPHGDARQLADLSVGLTDTEITPVHAALFAAIYANDGAMPEPLLAVARDGALGRSPEAVAPAPARTVVDAALVPQIVHAMMAVTAAGGTAAGTAPPGFPVAMKTGTAAEPGLGYHVNYIGVGPMPSPELAFAIRITGQPSSPSVNRAAREVLSSLLGRLGESRRR